MEEASTTNKETRKPARSPQGFAAMSPEERRAVASRGGKAAHAMGVAHQFTSDEARAAGKKGGTTTSQDHEHMVQMGRRGGAKVSQDREHMAELGRKGGAAMAAREGHMAAIGKRGGLARRRAAETVA